MQLFALSAFCRSQNKGVKWIFSKKYIYRKQYLFYPFILTSTKCSLSWILTTREAAHMKVISEFHDAINCRRFWNLKIWCENSYFERENLTLQFCPQFNFAHNSILSTIQFCPQFNFAHRAVFEKSMTATNSWFPTLFFRGICKLPYLHWYVSYWRTS